MHRIQDVDGVSFDDAEKIRACQRVEWSCVDLQPMGHVASNTGEDGVKRFGDHHKMRRGRRGGWNLMEGGGWNSIRKQ